MKLSSLKNDVDLNINQLDEESKGTTMNEEIDVYVLTPDEHDREDDQLVSTDDLLLALEVENG